MPAPFIGEWVGYKGLGPRHAAYPGHVVGAIHTKILEGSWSMCEGPRSDAMIASYPVAPSHFLNERIPNMTASNDTTREIAKALRHHVDAATLEKIVNELLDVPGNRSFREAIALARELMRR